MYKCDCCGNKYMCECESDCDCGCEHDHEHAGHKKMEEKTYLYDCDNNNTLLPGLHYRRNYTMKNMSEKKQDKIYDMMDNLYETDKLNVTGEYQVFAYFFGKTVLKDKDRIY